MSNQRINSYNGNSNLKQIGWEHQYTKEQVEEIIKCTGDPTYFIETYCKIVTINKLIVHLDLLNCIIRYLI